ncbi:MAG: biopolymer transporter ExbD [Verrucomicrobiota bacterium]
MIRSQLRSAKNPKSSVEDARLDVSALIDVSFLLLIYFLVTSTLDPIEGDLGLTLPGGGPSSVSIDSAEIEVLSDGSILYGGEVVSSDLGQREIPRLLNLLRDYRDAHRLIEGGSEPIVVVKADDLAPGQRFIDVLNSLAQLDLDHIVLGDSAR